MVDWWVGLDISFEIWFHPPIDPTIIDIRMILNVKALISIRCDTNINGAVPCNVIKSAQFSHLNPSITPGNHQWWGAVPLFSRRGVQMIIGVYRFAWKPMWNLAFRPKTFKTFCSNLREFSLTFSPFLLIFSKHYKMYRRKVYRN